MSTKWDLLWFGLVIGVLQAMAVSVSLYPRGWRRIFQRLVPGFQRGSIMRNKGRDERLAQKGRAFALVIFVLECGIAALWILSR